MKQKTKVVEPKIRRVIIFLLITEALIIMIALSLHGQKNLVNSYLVNIKCREAISKANKVYLASSQSDFTKAQLQDIMKKSKQMDNGFIGITVKSKSGTVTEAGKTLPENLFELKQLAPGETLSFKNIRQYNYSRISYLDNENPIYMDMENNNWIYHGIEKDFSWRYTLEPLSKKEVSEIFTMEARENQVRGYQDVWVEFIDSCENTIYIGYSVPMTDTDFQLCFILSIGYILASIVVFVIVFVIVISGIRYQYKFMSAYYTDKRTMGRNWTFFENKVSKRLVNSKKRKKYAMVKLSLVNYDTYCLAYGEEEGDRLLQEIYQMMEKNLPKQAVFARKEAADFGIFMTYSDKIELFDKISSLISSLENVEACCSISLQAGIYLIDSLESITVLDAYNLASIAYAKAHEASESRILFFSRRMKEEIQWERSIEKDFQSAIDNREFEVYLQPIYDVETEKAVAAEATARWNRPTEGYLTEERFMPVLEKSGFINKLDDYMLREIARIQADRIERDLPIVPVSVKISRHHFVDENLAKHIADIVNQYNIPREYIEIELTEASFLDEKDRLINIIQELKKMEFLVVLDDYGSGYSSLKSMIELPVDILKLDSELFAEKEDYSKNRLIVEEIIKLAKHLNLKIAADGVEYRSQVEELAKLGCDQIQGLYYTKPMPASKYDRLFEE